MPLFQLLLHKKELLDENDRLKRRNEALQAELNDLRIEFTQLERELVVADAQIKALGAAVKDLSPPRPPEGAQVPQSVGIISCDHHFVMNLKTCIVECRKCTTPK